MRKSRDPVPTNSIFVSLSIADMFGNHRLGMSEIPAAFHNLKPTSDKPCSYCNGIE